MTGYDDIKTFKTEDGRVFSVQRDPCAPCPIDDRDGSVLLYIFASKLCSPCELPGDIHDTLIHIADTDLGANKPDWFDDASVKRKVNYLEDTCAVQTVYYMEHSDFRYSTSSFCDPWDSGPVGVIWTPKEFAMDKNLERTCQEALVEMYDMWAHGYAWVVFETEDIYGESISLIYSDDYDLEKELEGLLGPPCECIG